MFELSVVCRGSPLRAQNPAPRIRSALRPAGITHPISRRPKNGVNGIDAKQSSACRAHCLCSPPEAAINTSACKNPAGPSEPGQTAPLPVTYERFGSYCVVCWYRLALDPWSRWGPSAASAPMTLWDHANGAGPTRHAIRAKGLLPSAFPPHSAINCGATSKLRRPARETIGWREQATRCGWRNLSAPA